MEHPVAECKEKKNKKIQLFWRHLLLELARGYTFFMIIDAEYERSIFTWLRSCQYFCYQSTKNVDHCVFTFLSYQKRTLSGIPQKGSWKWHFAMLCLPLKNLQVAQNDFLFRETHLNFREGSVGESKCKVPLLTLYGIPL